MCISACGCVHRYAGPHVGQRPPSGYRQLGATGMDGDHTSRAVPSSLTAEPSLQLQSRIY